jgi:hypothetical protein
MIYVVSFKRLTKGMSKTSLICEMEGINIF